jgi:hypothetical protein
MRFEIDRVSSVKRALGWLRLWLCCGLLSLTALSTGCSTFSLSDPGNSDLGSASYGRGELRSVERVSLGTAWKAVLGSAHDLGFAIGQQEKESLYAQLEAVGMGDRSIRILLKKQSMRMTEICIRVGANGDETISRLILSKIQQRL